MKRGVSHEKAGPVVALAILVPVLAVGYAGAAYAVHRLGQAAPWLASLWGG